MANNKTGFNYYNIDTDRYQDIKIKRLKKDFSCSGIAVYDYILCEIYRVKGCFIVWDESTAFDVAEYFGIKESLVNEIVNYCGVVGLFNKELLTRGNVITSLSIQKRYVEMCVRAKRKDVTIPNFIKIQEECKIIPEESGKIPEEQGDCSGSLQQSKVKESKVEDREDNLSIPNFIKIQEECKIIPEESGKIPEEQGDCSGNSQFITVPNSNLVKVDDLYEELKSSQWLEVVAMNQQITPESIGAFFKSFCSELKDSLITYKVRKDFCSHFVRWVKIEKTKTVKNGETTQTPVYRKPVVKR